MALIVTKIHQCTPLRGRILYYFNKNLVQNTFELSRQFSSRLHCFKYYNLVYFRCEMDVYS